MTNIERIAQAAKEIERECRGGYCDGHYRGWDFVMLYTRAPELPDLMEQLVGEVQQAKRESKRLDLKWWDTRYKPIGNAIRKTYGAQITKITSEDRAIYDKYIDKKNGWTWKD
jgi:hypothetical protein